MEIIIDKNNVYDFAMALTTRAGTMTDAYDQISITKDNYPMLDVYLSDAVVSAERELKSKLNKSNLVELTYKGSQVNISIEEQRMGDVSVYNLIESSIRLYLSYFVAASWLQSSPANNVSDVYATTSATHLQTAVKALNQKEKVCIKEGDYGDRTSDPIRLDDASGNRSADYGYRNADNVVARPGMRITDDEVLFVQDESGETTRPAITSKREHLMSNI